MARSYYQGKYKLVHPEKYDGDASNVVYRSSWELSAFQLCDGTERIVRWASEEVVIPYVSPIDGKVHRYFMDLKIQLREVDGSVSTSLVEIKPYSQTIAPVKTKGKRESTYMEEVRAWVVNDAKWKATELYCEKLGWNFVKWTEKNLQICHSTQNAESYNNSQKKTKDQQKAYNRKTSVKTELIRDIVKRSIANKIKHGE